MAIHFSEYLEQTLRPYRYALPVAISACAGILFGGFTLYSQAKSDTQMLRASSAHISTLVETQDRPDLQRLVKSMADEKRTALLIVQNGTIIASSRTLSELDRPFESRLGVHLANGTNISINGLEVTVPVIRPDGPKDLSASIVMMTPLRDVLSPVILATVLVFMFGVFGGQIFTGRFSKAAALSLRPIQDLDRAIRDLRTLQDPSHLKPFDLLELESIRKGVMETHVALVNTRDALAESKAKELTAEAYQRLIHDLHTQVASLRNWTKLMDSSKYGSSSAQEAAENIPKVAEEILLQVSAAKSNLRFENSVLLEKDIRTCVEKATTQALNASPRARIVKLKRMLPRRKVIAAHDPIQLKRAISNLVSNALDAAQTTVEVELVHFSGEVQIRVRDDGPGLSQEDAGLFLRGRKKSTKEDRPALGLSNANHIVQSHGGKVVYRTNPVGGACFEIRMRG